MNKLLLAAAFALAAVRSAYAAPLNVVELFTSQGCSDCPPANANFREIADRPDVLALSFSVTYWDRLGWKDTFGKQEFTRRQYEYAKDFQSNPYTPQIVIDGRTDLIGNVKREIEDTIAKQQPLSGPAITIANNKLSVAAQPHPAHSANVWLVRYDPHVVNVPVGRGENAGAVLPHRNVVRELTRLGSWNGDAETYDLPNAQPGLATAILVQDIHGPVLSALKL
ncbi:MAG TPA: DUF1223 domain-containing protein [Rhizomicrobium sp.]|jgi:hypothetical protein|nr:DUF1223 domain-containing protein [Rhizomicrobium sp.]